MESNTNVINSASVGGGRTLKEEDPPLASQDAVIQNIYQLYTTVNDTYAGHCADSLVSIYKELECEGQKENHNQAFIRYVQEVDRGMADKLNLFWLETDTRDLNMFFEVTHGQYGFGFEAENVHVYEFKSIEKMKEGLEQMKESDTEALRRDIIYVCADNLAKDLLEYIQSHNNQSLP